MGDLSVFDESNYGLVLRQLHTNFVMVGLNISTIDVEMPLSNFHGENGEVYKARFALEGTPLWGGYMTDVIKDFKEPSSQNMRKYLRQHPVEELEHCDRLRAELSRIGADSCTLVAFGNDVEDILLRQFSGKNRVLKIPHYAWRVPKERYRKAVHARLSQAGILDGSIGAPALRPKTRSVRDILS